MENVVFICASPCIDKYIYVDTLELAREQKASRAEAYLGGKGVNGASMFALAGGCPRLLTVLPRGSGYEKTLSDRGVDADVVYTRGTLRENLTFVEKSGRETRVSMSAPELSVKAAELFIKKAAALEGFAVLSGSVPDSLKDRLVKALSRASVRLAVDSKNIKREDLAALSPFAVKPNAEEAREFSGIEITDAASAFEAARAYHACGVENVIVSMGGDGAALSRGGSERIFVPSFETDVVSTVGAGDSMLAGFIFGAASGRSLRESLAIGAALAASKCGFSGTSMPDKATVEKFIKCAIH